MHFMFFLIFFMPFCGALEQYKSASKFIFDIHKTQSLKGYLLRNKIKRFDLKLCVFSIVSGYKVIPLSLKEKA